MNHSSGNEQGSDSASQDEESITVDASKASHNYCFGPSTITVSRIQEMTTLWYFGEGDAQVPREETVPEPTDDEAVVFEEFFATGLWMPLSMRILVTSHLSMWMVMTIMSVCGKEAKLISLVENVVGMWDNLVLTTGPSTTTWLTSW
jgi:hypothetical protein